VPLWQLHILLVAFKQLAVSKEKNGDSACFKITVSQPTLVVKDGKQSKGHRNLLSKASSFFQKTLVNDWKESREEVIRLEVLTEAIMEEILEFSYSGSVYVGSTERAEDLIVAADYLFLPKLKIVAGRFIEL